MSELASEITEISADKPLSNVAGHSRGTTLYATRSLGRLIRPSPFRRLVTEYTGQNVLIR